VDTKQLATLKRFCRSISGVVQALNVAIYLIEGNRTRFVIARKAANNPLAPMKDLLLPTGEPISVVVGNVIESRKVLYFGSSIRQLSEIESMLMGDSGNFFCALLFVGPGEKKIIGVLYVAKEREEMHFPVDGCELIETLVSGKKFLSIVNDLFIANQTV